MLGGDLACGLTLDMRMQAREGEFHGLKSTAVYPPGGCTGGALEERSFTAGKTVSQQIQQFSKFLIFFCKEFQYGKNIIYGLLTAQDIVHAFRYSEIASLGRSRMMAAEKIMVLPAYLGALDRQRQRETAFITGASSGIGLDLAHLMAPDFDLIITARNQAALEKLANELQTAHGNHVHVIPADLAQPEAPQQIFAEIERRGLPVDILINNAGFGSYGVFAESDPRTSLDMVEVNIAALTALTRLALPAMIERKRGRIMNVASTAGFQPGPLMAVYYATKAYVIMFSEAIANELKGSGTTVTCFCPGATATNFAGRANTEESRLFKLGP